MQDVRRTLLHTTGLKPMFAVTLRKPDGSECVSTARFINAEAARKFWTNAKGAAAGHTVLKVEAM